jgi:RNA polymerase II-associated protein 3
MLGRSEEAIQGIFLSSITIRLFMVSPVDLRAVLRLQPSNREALAELVSLIPLVAANSSNNTSIDISGNHRDDSKPSTSKHESSTSPSTKAVDMDPKSLQRLGIPKPKPIKQPSFARTKGDDRKLKIILMAGGDSVRNRGSGNLQTNGKENISATISRHGKEKAGALRSQRTKEMERMKAECLVYPSWDRYEVKKAD